MSISWGQFKALTADLDDDLNLLIDGAQLGVVWHDQWNVGLEKLGDASWNPESENSCNTAVIYEAEQLVWARCGHLGRELARLESHPVPDACRHAQLSQEVEGLRKTHGAAAIEQVHLGYREFARESWASKEKRRLGESSYIGPQKPRAKPPTKPDAHVGCTSNGRFRTPDITLWDFERFM